MRGSHGRGGRPQMHLRGKQIASAAIAAGSFPEHLSDVIDRLRGYRATRVRAELQAAVEWGVLDLDSARWVYQHLSHGKSWYCQHLTDGRGWNHLHDRCRDLRFDDPTIPAWWFNR